MIYSPQRSSDLELLFDVVVMEAEVTKKSEWEGKTIMTTVRIVSLVSVALLTMGSGGVKRSSDASEATAQQAEPVLSADEQELESTLETESDEPIVLDAASDAEAAPTPIMAGTTPDDGAAVELALSDDYIQGRYFTTGGLLGFDNMDGHVGAYFSDNRDIILSIGLMTAPAPILKEGLSFSVGGRGYLGLLSDPDDDVFGAAPGAEARYRLPVAHPTYAVGSIFYAPDILTLGDAESILDLDLRVEAELVENAIGFVGYREFRFDSDEGDDKKAASEIQIGGRFAF